MENPAGWSLDGVRKEMATSEVAAYLYDEDRMIGYAHYDAVPVPGDAFDRVIMWERSICFRLDYQDDGHGATALRIALVSVAPQRSLGWIGGRTQNPLMFRRYARLAGGSYPLLPFTATYDADPQDASALAAVEAHLGDEALDSASGIARAAYREGRLSKQSDRVRAMDWVEKRLDQWQFNPGKGDAIVTMARIWPARWEPEPEGRLQVDGPLGDQPVAVRDQLREIYAAAFLSRPYEEAWNNAEIERALWNDQRLYVATIDGRIAGLGALRDLAAAVSAEQRERLVATDGVRNWARAAFISEVAVDPSTTSNGVGQAIVRRLLHDVAADVPVVLQIHAANDTAFRLYRRHGFRLSRTPPRPIWARRADGQWRADLRHFMVR
jgi:ribosomal protein S18 acetylase RimI-like enzyme